MTVQAYILMTTAQKIEAEALDDMSARLGAREIDNPLANNLGYGQIFGMWVAPARLLNDPFYARWVPTLGLLPIHIMDSEVIFIPLEP